MKVEIWSDIACPWCYIGRRRFEKALDKFDHSDKVEVIWRSFQLDPDAPGDYPGTVNDMLVQRYGVSREQAASMNARVTALAAQEGLEYHMEWARPVNSMDAHRLLHLAYDYHLQSEMKERIQKAYFTEGLLISDVDTLVKLGVEVGLDAVEVRRMLAGNDHRADVLLEHRRAVELGSNGVPFFVFDQKYAVSGAQPAELFVTALERAWSDSQESK